MEFKDYYATLGVTKSASEKEIKQAFRKLARKLHPDVNPGDKAAEARFKEINEAYEVLGDPATRKKYDELGANWRHVRAGAGARRPQPVRAAPRGRRRRRLPHDDAGRNGGDVRRRSHPFSDFFTTFFGGGRRRQAPARRRGRARARAATSSTRSS